MFANRAVGPSVAHAEHARRAAAGALRAAAAGAHFAGAAAPRPLPPSAAAWVADKRRELTGLMWGAAGIVRRQADMKGALQAIAQLGVEAKALGQAYGVNTGGWRWCWCGEGVAGPRAGAIIAAGAALRCRHRLFAPTRRRRAHPPLPPLLPPPPHPPFLPNAELVELRNLVTVGELIMSSALQRRESRGGHYCADFPREVPQVGCVAA